MRIHRHCIFFLFVLLTKVSTAQIVTEIYGTVIDASNKEPIPYVNVRLGLLKATLTDPKGEYRIRSSERVDSISFSYIGFRTRTVHIKRGGTQELNIEMGSDELKLVEITVKAGKKKKRVIDTTANYVFYQVLKHKDQNRVNNLVSYKYENYDRFQISLLNPSEKFQNFALFRPFGFAFANKDTTETGSMYIPGVIKENISDVYSRTQPRKQQRVIMKAEKMTGVNNPTVYNLVEVEFRENDPYDNLYYFARTFFSAPFAPIGLGIYHYYLTDTLKIDGRVSYKLHFVGKTKEDLALKGYAWIDSATWAIRYIQYRPNEKANLNFVNDYDAKVDFTLVDGKYWMKSREDISSVGSLFKKRNKLGMYIQKLVEKRNFETNVDFPDTIFSGPEEKILLDSARLRPRSYWDTARFSPLSPSQKRVFEIADTFQKVPAFKMYQWLGVFFTSAFADAGPVSIGRVLNFISKNNVEGYRVRFGLETRSRFMPIGTPVNNFFRTFYLTGYGAYGFKDKDYKYMALMRINLPRKNDRWNSLEAFYRYDIKVPGQDESQTLLSFDNVITLASGRVFSKLMKVTEFGISVDKDWFKDFSTIIGFKEKTYFDVPGVSDFSQEVNNVLLPIKKFNVTEFVVDSRYSRKTLYTAGVFYRYYATTKYPVVMFRYTLNIGDIRGQHFNSHNMLFTFKQRLFSAIGYTNYEVKAGKVLGRAPYTSCYLTQGNIGVFLDRYNYNLLREFEFVTDQYAQVWVEHHFNGFFFNKIPGINKLKLREIIIFKGLMGSFTQKNRELLTVPAELTSPSKIPYVEVGFGIENILYLFRVDFLWRATYRNNGGQNWAIKFVLKPSF
ncbi:MAG: DUF5686 family protein [Bacteroidota bacterium]